MLNNTTRCLKLIFLCQCVRLQAILNTSEPTLSHSNVAGNFLRGHFLPYSKTHGFFVGCENVHDLRSQFARTFHLTVCLGQETVSFFEKNDQLQQPLYNNQPCFFHKLLGNNLLHMFIPCIIRRVIIPQKLGIGIGTFLGG